MSWGFKNPCFTKFSVINFLNMACNQRYPTNIENSRALNTRLIVYFAKVSMKLLFQLQTSMRCITALQRYFNVTFYTKLQIRTL